MRRMLLLFTLAGAMLLGCTGVVLAQHQASRARQAARHLPPPGRYEQVCPKPNKPGEATCLSKRRTDANPDGAAPTVNNPTGYLPGDLQKAYNLQPPSGSPGSGPTVAIVDAYDDPKAEDDLQTYRTGSGKFDLGACTTDTGCFRKVDQRGGTSYPSPDAGWAQEISLDLDMVSAICPNCKILLVEADNADLNSLGAGVDTAVGLGAKAVSNSYGAPEFSGETSSSIDSHYHHPGVAITASSGDDGYGVGYPAASRFVTAVGGTRLSENGNAARGWTETAWSGAGSGCSAYVSKPRWQTDRGCSKRTVADVAAVADPNTGVAVYDSYSSPGWQEFGGTSVSTVIIAGVYALAGNTSSINDRSYPYGHVSDLYDITSGSNGNCRASANAAAAKKKHKKPNEKRKKYRYLCASVPGYDGPTGNGTPNGTGAF